MAQLFVPSSTPSVGHWSKEGTLGTRLVLKVEIHVLKSTLNPLVSWNIFEKHLWHESVDGITRGDTKRQINTDRQTDNTTQGDNLLFN